MNIETFIQRMNTYDTECDHNKIIEDLKSLATHRTLLSEYLYQGIQQNGFSVKHMLYNAYAFVLHSTKNTLFAWDSGHPSTRKKKAKHSSTA